MEQYDQLYELYDRHDTDTLRALQDLVDLFPLVESTVALDRWEEIYEDLLFDEGRAGDILRTVYALNRFAAET